MTDVKELRGRLKGLRARAAEIEAGLAGADGAKRRSMRFELASVREEIVDCGAQLREAMPNHRVTYKRSGGPLGMDYKQFLEWREQDQTGDDEVVTDREIAIAAMKRAQTVASTRERGSMYAAARAEGLSMRAIGERFGVDKSTVSRVLIRYHQKLSSKAQTYFTRMKEALAQGMDLESGRNLIAGLSREVEEEEERRDTRPAGKPAKPTTVEVLYALAADSRDESGEAYLDLSNPEVLETVMGRLSPTQLLYLYLYYGEWLSLREIRDLVGVDKSSVLRCIRRALERMSADLDNMPFHIEGLDSLEELLMARFNDLDPQDVVKRRRSRAGRPPQCTPGAWPSKKRLSEEEVLLSEEIVRMSGPKDVRCGNGKLLVFLSELTADLEVYLGRTPKPWESGRMIRRVLTALIRKVRSWLAHRGEQSGDAEE